MGKPPSIYIRIPPLGKTVLTPWQEGTLQTNSAKGICIDNVDITHSREKQH